MFPFAEYSFPPIFPLILQDYLLNTLSPKSRTFHQIFHRNVFMIHFYILQFQNLFYLILNSFQNLLFILFIFLKHHETFTIQIHNTRIVQYHYYSTIQSAYPEQPITDKIQPSCRENISFGI